MKHTVIKGLRWYQQHSLSIASIPGLLVSPQCRFHPTCSEYAIGALEQYGLAKGSLKAILRVARCNPWSAGGIDLP